MVSGQTFEYDLSMVEVNNFTTWYNNCASGTGPAFYAMNKIFKPEPFTSLRYGFNGLSVKPHLI
jgi:hypothetical protein